MRKGDVRIFENRENLIKMIEMRESGISFAKIAKHFNCDHTSVIYRWKKYQTGYSPKKYKQRKIKVFQIKEGHCPKCDLLLTSEFSCDYCLELKIKNNI